MSKALIILSILFNLACGFGAAAVDRINITDYGATPNDGTDDTAAINSAVAAGTSIYFPPGSYNYTGRITVPAHKSYRFYGDGPGVSTILFTGHSAGIYAPTVGARTLNVDGLTLEALTGAAGRAIYAAFGNANANLKYHTATIQNVEIRGNTETGNTGGYWTTGIYLSRAQNAAIDKVDISGNTGVTSTGIQWTSLTTVGTTGIHLTNVEIKFCNAAIVTSGWVEGFYMSGFEVVSCGTGGQPALSLASSQSSSPSPAFTLLNGHVDMIGDGVRMTNLSAIKVSHVDFEHANPVAVNGTHLALTNCIAAIISDNTFTSQVNGIANENGVFLTSTNDARVSGNIFRTLKPTQAGSCIVAYTGSSTIRVTDNIFDFVRQAYDNRIGTSFYYDTNNIVK
jgi:hypothetical protein